jgi:hypothetical protein
MRVIVKVQRDVRVGRYVREEELEEAFSRVLLLLF